MDIKTFLTTARQQVRDFSEEQSGGRGALVIAMQVRVHVTEACEVASKKDEAIGVIEMNVGV